MRKKVEYTDSFGYYIENELNIKIDDIWNWELNVLNPYELAKQSNKKVWLYCLEHDYHNWDREGNKVGYEISCANFYNERRCGYCNSFASHKVHWQDSLAYNYPDIAEMIAIPENDLTFDDCFGISPYSNKKFYIKCNYCNKLSKTKKDLNHVQRYGFKCGFCDERYKTPEKFMCNILEQLNIDFIPQLSRSTTQWCYTYKYDFYIPSLNAIIETNGEQHYRYVGFKRTLEQEQMNDLFKRKCAEGHVDNYIVIDCRYSTLEWLKENTIKELSSYFDLSNINWELAYEESQSSLIRKAWELWDNGIHSTKEIGDILGKHRKTIKEWLKKGNECGKCSYTIELANEEKYKKITKTRWNK